ncbi:LuxR family transcriptional regulator [Methylobacterium oryzisoli]|uniref:LuxR family transcriptional regulator n=1 Tax=Methylobacterium oryzisoli TaxID=3385502 RepID=UPI00389179EF
MSRKTLDLTLAYLRSLDRTASAHDVAALLRTVLDRYGVEHMLAGTIPDPGTPPGRQYGHALLDGMPTEWIRRYALRGYLYRDATVRHMALSQEPFTWSAIAGRYKDDPISVRVMQEAGEFGIRAGITIPLLTLDAKLAGASFSGRHMDVPPEEIGTLHLIATYAFAHLLLLQGTEGKAPIRLTPREREVLQWAADGKTAWEIGEILGISQKGVEHHLGTSRRKLGAHNGVQTVATALRMGLIA